LPSIAIRLCVLDVRGVNLQVVERRRTIPEGSVSCHGNQHIRARSKPPERRLQPGLAAPLSGSRARAHRRGVTLSDVTVSNRMTRPLTDLQQSVLDFIWANGPATADQVRESLLPKHPLKDSSVRTILRRLEARGYLTHRLEGKSFIYEAKISASRVAFGTVRRLIERFWAGSAEQFVAGMVDAKVLSKEALQRLAKKVKASK
jgi:BlaI family penicillinase repressor